jgi:hypothetical protein
MIAVAVSDCVYSNDSTSEFITHEAVAEITLQLLASSCVLIRTQQQQQQQGLLSRQLGKRMRGDLLLLPDPQLQLSHLLPSRLFLSEDIDIVSNVMRSTGARSARSDQQNQIMLRRALRLMVVLQQNAASYFPNHRSSRVFQQCCLLLHCSCQGRCCCWQLSSGSGSSTA